MAKKMTAPSGLAISRNGSNFTFSWKLGKNHKNQELEYRTYHNSWRKWTSYPASKIKKGTTSVSVEINITTVSFTKLEFRVRGKNGKKHTDWKSKVQNISRPPMPYGSAELKNEFRTDFSWGINTDSTKWNICSGYEWKTVLAPNYNSTNGAYAPWDKVGKNDKGNSISKTGAFSGSLSREEAGWSNPNYSYTRWVAIRAIGPAGYSKDSKGREWTFLSHVYARTQQTSNVTASLQSKSGGGYTVSVNWTTNGNASKPVDKTIVQYLIAEPETAVKIVGNKKVTDISCPSSGSWQSINALGGILGNRGISFPITADLGKNRAVFVRVNTVHDADTSTVEGEAELVSGSLTALTPPSGLTVTESDPSTRRFTVTARDTTNLSAAFIEILYRTSSNMSVTQTVGIIPAGETSITCQLPEWPVGDSISLGVRSIVGNYSPVLPDPGINSYTVERRMISEIEWDGGAVPLPPENFEAVQLPDADSRNSIQVSWKWSWTGATGAELSWADHKDAWESTNAPSTYTINNVHASKWIISDLAVGKWYVRMRLFKTTGDSTTYGTYTDIKEVKLSAAPETPYLVVSDGIISETGKFTCYWSYVSNDGTGQLQADITEAFIDGDSITYLEPPIDSTNMTQRTFTAEELGWKAGDAPHYLVVRVTSISGEESAGWSKPVPIRIAEKATAEITQTSLSLVEETRVNDLDEEFVDTHYELTTLPLTATTIGAGIGGTTRYIIERDGSYHPDRPEGIDYQGYDKETIVIKTMPENSEQSAESQVSIDLDDLIGRLDDGATYTLIAEAIDSYGQSTQAEPINFRVNWGHSAIDPTADIEMDRDNFVAFITPNMPDEGYEPGDTCDIYRLSADLPELVIENAQFDVKYVDPYPTLGQFGGYRIVYKTRYNDYITSDGGIGWEDYTADDPAYRMDVFGIVIDFDGEQLVLPYDVTVSNAWKKEFIETKYLGGSVQGDWNPGVSKSASLSTNIPIQYDPDNVEMIRRLAVYPGKCHVRTPDGSSYTANVEVKEDREERKVNMIAKISLDITKIDSDHHDGMLYSAWNDEGGI